eukprot:9966668-Alexandrium_andersonii.AAC.1
MPRARRPRALGSAPCLLSGLTRRTSLRSSPTYTGRGPSRPGASLARPRSRPCGSTWLAGAR